MEFPLYWIAFWKRIGLILDHNNEQAGELRGRIG